MSFSTVVQRLHSRVVANIPGLESERVQFCVCREISVVVAMRVDLSPRLGGGHTVANQPPTTVLLSFTFILPPSPLGTL